MKTKLFAWVSWIPFLVSAAAEWGFDFDLPLTPALWLVVAAVVFFATNAPAALTTNSWTDGNGKWELGSNWDHGVPALSNSANVIRSTGPAFSTLTTTINAATVLSNNIPGNNCLTISNLALSVANAMASQTLLLTNASLLTPLKILDTLTIGIHSSVVISNAALQIGGTGAGNFSDDGGLTMFGGTLTATNAGTFFAIGDSGAGRMTVLGGTWQTWAAFVGDSIGSQGTLTVAGGNNLLSVFLDIGFDPGVNGTVWVTGGQLTVTNAFIEIGDEGLGQMTVSNGTWLAGTVDVSLNGGAQGTLTIAGGTNKLLGALNIAEATEATGTVWMTGGQLTVTNDQTIVGDAGVGRMTVSNGTWRAAEVDVGEAAGSQGTLTVAGGTNKLASLLVVGHHGVGAVWLTGGQLIVTNNETDVGDLGVGQMTVSNGAWLALQVFVGNQPNSQGTLTTAGGTNSLLEYLDVAGAPESTGTVWLTGGQLTITNDETSIGDVGVGQMTVSNGICRARNITVAASAGSRGTVTVAGGVTSVYSNLTVGLSPNCSSTGIVNVTGGALRVTNNVANAVLEVRSGTLTQSGGTLDVDRLVITNDCAHVALTGGTLIYGILDLSTNQFADADGDGMSNNYELEHGLDPLDPTDAGLDYDNDGQSNLQEHEMNTDPNDANSYFHITSIVATNKNVLITWNTATMTGNGLSFEYYVLWGTNLTGGVTNNLAGVFVFHGTPITSTNYLDVGGATNRPPRFYRILGRPNIG